jgi:hypothetical protein
MDFLVVTLACRSSVCEQNIISHFPTIISGRYSKTVLSLSLPWLRLSETDKDLRSVSEMVSFGSSMRVVWV